jgi:hypothetical protein
MVNVRSRSSRQGDWFTSIDLQGSYFYVIPAHRRFLNFSIQGTAYEYLGVPFGLALAPRMFNKCVEEAVVPRRIRGLRTPEWRSGLRHSVLECFSVLEESLQNLVRSWAVSQPTVIGSPIGRHTIGPASYGLGFGLGRPFIVNKNLFSTDLPS